MQGSIFKKLIDLIMGVIPTEKDIKKIKENDIKKKIMSIFGP